MVMKGAGSIGQRWSCSTIAVVIVVVLMMILSCVSGEVLSFCPPGENAKVNDLVTNHDCKQAKDWIRTTMLPTCLSAGRQKDRQQVFPIKLNLDATVEEELVEEEVEVVVEEEVKVETVEEEKVEDTSTIEEVANRRHRGLRRNDNLVVKESSSSSSSSSSSILEELEDANNFHQRMLGGSIPDCFKNWEMCKTSKPHPACCLLCPDDCYSTNPKSRRRHRRRQEVIQGEVTVVSAATEEEDKVEEEMVVEEELEPITAEELALFASEAKVTMVQYLAYVDTLCTEMYQQHADETKCFGDTPSILQCNSFVVI